MEGCGVSYVDGVTVGVMVDVREMVAMWKLLVLSTFMVSVPSAGGVWDHEFMSERERGR